MKTNDDVKKMVQEKYGSIAQTSKKQNLSSCCGTTCCSSETEVYSIMADEYSGLEGYSENADLGLGCGLPTEFAKIELNDVVVDLGSGAGNDAFVARKVVGENGKVIGIDFTQQMIDLSRQNAEKLSYTNVEFLLGDIENIPLENNVANVVVSNCVLNLVPNKLKVFQEIHRILNDGGHFSISDIVYVGHMPDKWKEVSELYAGCVSGAIKKEEYLQFIEKANFKNIVIQKEKEITIPHDILMTYLTESEINEFKNSNSKIISITVYAEK